MTKSTPLKPERVYSFDAIRILATLMVIMIHTSGTFVSSNSASFPDFTIGNFLDSLSQIAVPLFLMLSGALMLNESKNFTIKKSISSALNIFAILGFWSVFYAVTYTFVLPMLQGEKINFDCLEFISDCLLGHYHLWYLYLIIGLYLITPLLRLFVKKSNAKIIGYFLLVALIFRFVPQVLHAIVYNTFHITLVGEFITKFKIDYFSAYIVYYIAGWFITNIILTKKQRIVAYISGVMGFFLTFGLIEIFKKSNNKIYESLYSASSIAIFCAAVATFVFIYYFFMGKTFGKASGFVAYLSKITFGVYLVHEVFRNVFETLIRSKCPNSAVYIMICFTLTVVVSFGVAFAMSKIPLVKKLIRC